MTRKTKQKFDKDIKYTFRTDKDHHLVFSQNDIIVEKSTMKHNDLSSCSKEIELIDILLDMKDEMDEFLDEKGYKALKHDPRSWFLLFSVHEPW